MDSDHPITVAPVIADDLAGAIGNTPLIRLRRASDATGCTILGKAEFMNPGGSVKDRAGLAIIQDAERARRAQAGRSGGRGNRWQYRHRAYAWLAMRADIAASSSCRRHRAPGEDRLPPHDRRRPAAGAGQAVPRSRATMCMSRSGLAEETGAATGNAIWANQFDNLANREGHRADHRAGDLAPDRRTPSTPSPAPAAPAARWRASRWR